MNIRTKGINLVLVLLACAFSTNLLAQDVFFGEDLSNNDARLSAWPTADAARNDFLAGLSAFGTDDFESYTNGDGEPLVVDFGVGTATLEGSGSIVTNAGFPNTENGRYPTSGSNYWSTSENFTMVFSEGVRAFGFYGTDVGDFSGTLTLTLTNGVTVDLDIPHSILGDGNTGGSVIFYGVITEETFTSISFENSDPGDTFGFDDFYLSRNLPAAPTVPVPSMGKPGILVTTLLIGLFGLFAFRIRS